MNIYDDNSIPINTFLRFKVWQMLGREMKWMLVLMSWI